MVEPDRPQITIQYGVCALHAGKSKARIQTHTQNVILIACPRQQWLRECAPVSRLYMYFAYFVKNCLNLGLDSLKWGNSGCFFIIIAIYTASYPVKSSITSPKISDFFNKILLTWKCVKWPPCFSHAQWRTQKFCSGGGSTNSVEDTGQRERASGGSSPLVRGSGGSCNLVQEI